MSIGAKLNVESDGAGAAALSKTPHAVPRQFRLLDVREAVTREPEMGLPSTKTARTTTKTTLPTRMTGADAAIVAGVH